MSDRLIFETAPNLHQSRMDSLVLATVDVFAQEIRQDLRDPAEATAVASEMFFSTYNQRMDEYAAVGEDWFRIILSKFGRHFSKAVNRGELSMEIYLDSQGEAVRMHAAFVAFVPELFKA